MSRRINERRPTPEDYNHDIAKIAKLGRLGVKVLAIIGTVEYAIEAAADALYDKSYVHDLVNMGEMLGVGALAITAFSYIEQRFSPSDEQPPSPAE